MASSAVLPSGTRRRARAAGRVVLVLLGGALLLGGCTSGADDDGAASSAADAPTGGPPVGDPPSEDVDSVQTDAPVTGSSVVLTSAEVSPEDGVLRAAAFVQGVLETGGSCVLTAEKEGATALEGEPVPAEPGPSSTECGALTVALPEDAAGTWLVSVTYTSASTDLTSESREVTV